MTLSNTWAQMSRMFKFVDNDSNKNGKSDGKHIIFNGNNVCVHSHCAGYNKKTIHNSGRLIISQEKFSSNGNEKPVMIFRLSWIPSVIQPTYCRNDEKRSETSQVPYLRFQDNPDEEVNRKISVESYDSGYHEEDEYRCETDKEELQDGFSSESPLTDNYCRTEETNKVPSDDITDATSNVNLLSTTERNNKYIRSREENENAAQDLKEGKMFDDKNCKDTMAVAPEPESTSTEYFNFISTSTKYQRGLNFPCKFTVDLGYVKSLRLLFSQDDDSGQFIITSKENQFKILHFHRGGLRQLSNMLQQWNRNVFTSTQVENTDDGQLYKHFKICCSELQRTELYSEDLAISRLTLDDWLDMLAEDGQIEDEMLLRKKIFYGGIEKKIRQFLWPFLLNCYSFDSSQEERSRIRQLHREQYNEICNKRKHMLDSNNVCESHPLKTVDYLIHKDVMRTDRTHPFYVGDDNPNLILMKKVLLNYTVYDNDHTYMQGMSDLLAPILVEIKDEAEAFWCFVDIIKKGLFVCTPTDSDMEKHLMFLRELIRVMQPYFYSHLESLRDGMELLFCHRWLLLCFKREFPEDVVLEIWEACWSCYLTDYFHLFVCLAIISEYGDQIIRRQMKCDDMLYYFSTLAMCMDGRHILKKARELLHTFRTLDEIPQSLAALCYQRGSNMWDSKHTPTVDN